MGSLSDNACTSSGAPLKYKWRRVSCVRDFPPGCGRNAPRINLKPQDTEAGASLGNKENLVTDEKRENGLSQPVVKSAVQDCVANGSDVANEKKVEVANGDCVKGFESGNESLSQQVMKSAVRDFPPGCGQNAPPINLKPQDTEAVASPGDELNLMADEKSVDVAKGDSVKAFESGNESPSQLLVQSALKLEVPSSLDDLVDMVVAAAGIKVELSPAVGPLGTNLPKAFGMEAPEISNEPQDPEAPAVVKSEGGMESKTVLEIGSMADGMAPACGSKAWSPLQWPISDANLGKDTTLKKKLPWRRVSAIRDFPPFCGRNALSPTEEERRRIVLGNKTSCPPHKAAVEGELLIETVTAKEQGSPARETSRTGVEELNGDVRDRSSQKRELKGSMPELELQTGKAGKPSIEKSRADVDASPVRKTVVAAVDELNGDVRDGHAQKRKLEGSIPERSTKSQKVIGKESEDVSHVEGEGGKEIAVYPLDKSFKSKSPGSAVAMGHDADRVIVQGLIAAPNCPWRQGKGVANTGVDTMMTVSEEKRRDISPVTRQEKSISAHKLKATKKVLPCGKAVDKGKDQLVVRDEGAFAIQEQDGNPSARHDSSPVTGQEKSISSHKLKAMKKLLPCGKEAAEKGKGQLVVKDMGDFVIQKQDGNPSRGKRPDDFEVTLPPFGPNSSSHGDERNKVREVLRLFQAICRKLLQAEEAKLKQKGSPPRRIDLQAAQIVRDKGKEVNTAKFIIGSVPGVEVGDEFQYRVELSLVGIHRVYQGGIDYTKHGGMNIATSIVASGVYADDLDDPNVLIYSGQGGNAAGKDKQPEDQKLERGNLALKNSITTKNPVRVVRGFKETKTSKLDARAKLVAIYTYDGLYTVERYWHEVGQHGKLVFMFELRRMPDQPELAWKEVKKSNKFKIRKGLCVDDISGGKELFPICAVNTEDDELPPAFNYITEMKYPDWCCPTPRQGCDCKGGCSDSKKCSCVVMNGGEIPYNYNGAIVEAKPLVYECGPSCKCPPSCYNRVSQHGIKIQLEIFKTESRGWGVRSLTSIPSGSFICEYFGEFLEDKEAEQRQNDEYLFDIGKNYSDFSLTDGLSTEVEDGCFTIDAAQFGNVGRFINHSCSPNLYAQNVLYDHEDKKMPHIMLFAAENIPPLQELTYHYNYKVDQVRDSSGNIKVKNCYCGSAECSGRMY